MALRLRAWGKHRNLPKARWDHTMRALITLIIYLAPFLLIGKAVDIWMKRRDVRSADVQAEGSPNRSRFLLGAWRNDG